MRLIYIANIRMPTEKAHGLQIMKMCEAFAKKSVEVELVLPWRFNVIKKDPFEYYGINKIFKITKLPSLDLIPVLGKIGFWLQSFSFSKFAGAYVLFQKADIIYSRDVLPLFWLSFYKKNIFWESHAGWDNFVIRRILKKCRKIICITEGLKEFYIKKGIAEDKILVVPDGVDIIEFDINIAKEEARQKLGLPSGKKIVLYAGSFYLYDWKGIDILLEAAGNFPGDFFFVLVGGGEKEINNIRTKYPLKNIILISHRPHKEIPYYLKAADILILPNKKGEAISEEYTSPLKLFEYMASGRPIIASNLSSIKEVLNNENAFLVEPNDSKKLTEAIIKISNDKEAADRIAQAAFARSKDYTWEKRARKILDFIKI